MMNWDIKASYDCRLYDLMGLDYCQTCRSYLYCRKHFRGRFMKQMTIFDIIEEPATDWRTMSLKQIASYIGNKTGLNFIPDTRYHGEFNEYIAYHTSHLFFTLGLSSYKTLDERNGKAYISVGYDDKKDHSGDGRPCDDLTEAIEFYKQRML